MLALTLDDYLAQASSDTWLVDGLLPIGGTAVLYGDQKLGKSFLAIQLAEALGNPACDEWITHPIINHTKVLYLQLDTPQSLWQLRLRSLQGFGFGFPNVWWADRKLLNAWPFDLMNPNHRALLHDVVISLDIGCVILDILREAHQEEENDSTAMKGVMSSLQAAIQPAALVFLGHAKKPAQDAEPNLISDLRGSGYLTGAVDTIARLTENGLWYVGRSVEKNLTPLRRDRESGVWVPV